MTGFGLRCTRKNFKAKNDYFNPNIIYFKPEMITLIP